MSARNWCYTLNNYTEDEVEEIYSIECRYHICGREIGSEGTPHLQGYIEFSKVLRLSAVKKLIPRGHWEQRRGSADEARRYCMKEGDYVETGEFKGKQGARSDLHAVMDMVKENKSKLEIFEEQPAVVARYPRFVNDYVAARERADTKEFRKVEVHVLWGQAGTGKTRIAHDLCPNIFTVSPGETFPFDGYDGETEILIDDFYGQLKHHDMLRILDGHQFKVNVKGGHRYAKWTQVFITSNKPPSEWYCAGLSDELKRRITDVTQF